MKKRLPILVILAIVALFVIVPQFVFKVDETQHVVITRFGEVRKVISEPGLNFKAPFVDSVNVLDKRLRLSEFLYKRIVLLKLLLPIDLQHVHIDQYRIELY